MNAVDADETLLLENVAAPWSSAFQLAMRAGITPAAAEAACERLRLAGYVQRIEQNLSYLPALLYAPAPTALNLIAERWQVPVSVVARKARLSEVRFRWLREAMEIAQEVNGLCSTLAQAKPEWRVGWEAGIVRTYRGAPLILHGRLGIRAPLTSGDEKRGAYYLLMDRGQQKTLGWWRLIRYLSIASRRDANQNGKRAGTPFPPLLFITTHAYRAAALLRLAHKFNARAPLAASWDRETLFTMGAHAAEWFTLVRDEPRRVCLKPAHPFSPEQFCVSAPKHWPFHMTRPRAAKLTAQPVPVLEVEANWSMAASAMETLENDPMRVLAFLCRHPLCPQSTLQAFLEISSQQAEMVLQKLHETGLATAEEVLLRMDRTVFEDEQGDANSNRKQQLRLFGRCDPASTEHRIADAVRQGAQVTTVKTDGNRSRTALAPKTLLLSGFWQATPAAVQLRACREGRNAGAYANAYAALCRERQARPYHALAVYDFFERLQHDCMRYAAATRKMAGVDADYYELVVFEDELQARTSFEHDGRRRYWCPDGFGVVRCGEHCTPFWLEIDGTLHTRARPDTGVWTQKFDTLCAYFCSGDWTRTRPAFPTLLIVTAQANIKVRLRETLERISNGQGMGMPAVFLASRDAWLQRGPLAPIWMNLSHATAPFHLDYAFAGAQQPGVLSATNRKQHGTSTNNMPDLLAMPAKG
jgi:hypothetical protein